MNDPNPQMAPLVQAVLQLWAAGMLLAIQLQWWLVLRLTNPWAAYGVAAAHAADLGDHLGAAFRRCRPLSSGLARARKPANLGAARPVPS